MYTLLLVDDEPVIRMTFRNLLPWDDTPWRIAGMVANGEEALDFLKKRPVDIVITDMMMPQMNGLELIRHLRKQQFAGAILVLSNYSDFSLVRQAMQLGARDYMLKADMEAESLRDALTRLSENLAPYCTPLEPGEAVMPDDYRRTLLRELMLGYALPENAVQSGGKLLPHAPYRLLYVALDRSGERTTARKSIRNVLLANFSEQTDVLCLGEQEHICLIPAAQADEAALVRRGVQLVRQLKIYLDCRANVLVSAAFPDTDGMCHQLARCRSDARVFFYEAQEGCLTVGGIVFSPLKDEPRPEEAAQQLAECFAHGSDHADAWVQALLDRCAARHVNPDSLMKLCLSYPADAAHEPPSSAGEHGVCQSCRGAFLQERDAASRPSAHVASFSDGNACFADRYRKQRCTHARPLPSEALCRAHLIGHPLRYGQLEPKLSL